MSDRRSEAALDAMINALSAGPEASDRVTGLGRLLTHLSSPVPSPVSRRPPLKRASTSRFVIKAEVVKEDVDPYTNAIWRPSTPAILPERHRPVPAAKRAAADEGNDEELSTVQPVLVEALRGLCESAVLGSSRSVPSLERWENRDTHHLLQSIMRNSVRTTLTGRSSPLLRGSPRREAHAIDRHSWDGWSREQSIEAVSLMHSPGQVRGYTRQLNRSLRHEHRDFTATPYHKVARMYPGGAHPEDDSQAISFMRGLSVVRTAPAPPSRVGERSLPRLCTRFGA